VGERFDGDEMPMHLAAARPSEVAAAEWLRPLFPLIGLSLSSRSHSDRSRRRPVVVINISRRLNSLHHRTILPRCFISHSCARACITQRRDGQCEIRRALSPASPISQPASRARA
jgi:hypothetical protein